MNNNNQNNLNNNLTQSISNMNNNENQQIPTYKQNINQNQLQINTLQKESNSPDITPSGNKEKMSKKNMILIILGLVTSLILLDSYITNTKLYYVIMINDINNSGVSAADIVYKTIIYFNYTLVLILTIISFIFYFHNKKNSCPTSLSLAYIIAGITYFILGPNNSITSIIYIASNIKVCNNNHSKKNTILLILNIIVIIIYIITIYLFITHTGPFNTKN